MAATNVYAGAAATMGGTLGGVFRQTDRRTAAGST